MMRIKIGFFRSIPGLSLIIGSILFDLWLSRPLFIPMYPWENFRLFNLGLAYIAQNSGFETNESIPMLIFIAESMVFIYLEVRDNTIENS